MSKLVLINDDEKLKYVISADSEIYYRRPNQTERNVWTRKATKRGVTDELRVAETALRNCVLGWKGVAFEKSAEKDAECTYENIMRLPQEHIVNLIERMGLDDVDIDMESDPKIKN